jgi:hypothetical protein
MKYVSTERLSEAMRPLTEFGSEVSEDFNSVPLCEGFYGRFEEKKPDLK